MKTSESFYQQISPFLNGLISLIFPNNCVICRRELNSQTEHICFLCESNLHYTYFEKYTETTPADEVFWGRIKVEHVYALLFFIKGNSTQKVLHHIKYHEGKGLGRMMGIRMGERLATSKKFKDVDVIVPIPLHSKKAFIRGYNQSQMIAKGISEAMKIPIVQALYRTQHDESQTRKSLEERYQNVRGKFALYPNALTDYQHVLIVDDVLTTGSTLEFASRAVVSAENRPKISLATIAMAHN